VFEATVSETDVLAAADRVIAAFAATDTDAYFACFHPQATFVFHTEPETLPDRAAYQRLWSGWIADGWRVVTCESAERIVTVVGDTGVFAHVVTTTTEVDGARTTTVERESIVFSRTDAGLVGVHEHLSSGHDA
jgi:ketosteroid isomerase-like protein